MFSENTLGPLSPSNFCTRPCFLAESCPSRIAWDKISNTNLIVLDESSFIGIKLVKSFGLLFVSTNPYTGIPIFTASCTAIFSFSTSTTKSASGRPFISFTPSKFKANFFISFSSMTASFLIILSSSPAALFSSYSSNLLIGTRIVFQFVSIPPNHLCDIYGIPVFSPKLETWLDATLFVPTTIILFPTDDWFLKVSYSSAIFSWVL